MIGVNFGAGSKWRTKDNGFDFANMRTELLWRFREALDPVSGQDIQLPPDRRLAAQLAAPRWKARGTTILIESKEEIRARLGSSTDDADAVILAWYMRDSAIARHKPKPDRPFYGGPDGWMR